MKAKIVSNGLFRVNLSFKFAVSIPNGDAPSCSHCGGEILLCHQICRSCWQPLIGPLGVPVYSEWNLLDSDMKVGVARGVFCSTNYGRLFLPDAKNVPLNIHEFDELLDMNDKDTRYFYIAHGKRPDELHRHLTTQ